jgi:hypothetical protein
MRFVRSTYWFLCEQLGLDIRKLVRAPLGLVRYFRDLASFVGKSPYKLRLQPCLHEWWQQAGAVGTEYFWQDLLVARMVHQAAPKRHIDVGSRLDGFVAHVASFRDIDVFDVRRLESRIPGVTFKQADMMNPDASNTEVTDSLSCLHAIEHFGLGRYGDPLNPHGSAIGIKNLASMLEPRGTMYLSCPVGNDEVFFNAHRALKPFTIERIAREANLNLKTCLLFNNETKAFENAAFPLSTEPPPERHSLAIYIFTKQ